MPCTTFTKLADAGCFEVSVEGIQNAGMPTCHKGNNNGFFVGKETVDGANLNVRPGGNVVRGQRAITLGLQNVERGIQNVLHSFFAALGSREDCFGLVRWHALFVLRKSVSRELSFFEYMLKYM